MAKNDIRDMARVLSSKYKMSQKDSEKFLSSFFDILNEGLDNEKQVKVKGFGTFKVVDVKERESVDVNTGERIKIESRSKITFTPDSVMKDLVNKPFAQFETVVLNEGVDFSDLDSSESISDEEPVEPVVIENVKSEVEEVITNDVVQEKPEEIEDDDEDDDIYVEKVKKRWYMGRFFRLFIVFVIEAVVVFYLGYNLGKKSHILFPITIAEEVVESNAKDSVANVPLNNTDSLEKTKKDSATVAKANPVVKVDEPVKQAEAVEKKQSEEKTVEVKEQNSDNDNALANARRIMSKGAYEIVGTQTTITVKKGQTLSKISKSYFGDGMECYLQVHNGITEVKEGDNIKIPKLVLKKIKNQK